MDRTKIRGLAPPKADPEQAERILRLSPFASATGSSRGALLDLGRVEALPRRHRIAQQGEAARALVLLGSGRVRVDRVTAGRVFPLGHRGPGETVGETAVGGGTHSTESATVLDDVEALVLPIGPFRKLLGADGAIRAAMTAALVERHRATEDRLESLLLHGVEARLIELLFGAQQRWGVPHASGELISAPFTHADLAVLIGSTRETVTLLLGKLRRAGLIDFEKRRIVIRDRAALEQRVSES